MSIQLTKERTITIHAICLTIAHTTNGWPEQNSRAADGHGEIQINSMATGTATDDSTCRGPQASFACLVTLSRVGRQ